MRMGMSTQVASDDFIRLLKIRQGNSITEARRTRKP